MSPVMLQLAALEDLARQTTIIRAKRAVISDTNQDKDAKTEMPQYVRNAQQKPCLDHESNAFLLKPTPLVPKIMHDHRS